MHGAFHQNLHIIRDAGQSRRENRRGSVRLKPTPTRAVQGPEDAPRHGDTTLSAAAHLSGPSQRVLHTDCQTTQTAAQKDSEAEGTERNHRRTVRVHAAHHGGPSGSHARDLPGLLRRERPVRQGVRVQ